MCCVVLDSTDNVAEEEAPLSRMKFIENQNVAGCVKTSS